jgi:hypothetical protein
MEVYDEKIGECKWAAVVGDGRSYAKIHQSIVSRRLDGYPVERRVFRDIDKAREWLEIPAGYVISYPD